MMRGGPRGGARGRGDMMRGGPRGGPDMPRGPPRGGRDMPRGGPPMEGMRGGPRSRGGPPAEHLRSRGGGGQNFSGPPLPGDD